MVLQMLAKYMGPENWALAVAAWSAIMAALVVLVKFVGTLSIALRAMGKLIPWLQSLAAKTVSKRDDAAVTGLAKFLLQSSAWLDMVREKLEPWALNRRKDEVIVKKAAVR